MTARKLQKRGRMSESPTTPSGGSHMRKCSRCNRVFSSRKGCDDHILMKHKGIGERIAVPKREPDEESLADIAVNAYIKRACGEGLDPLEESLIYD